MEALGPRTGATHYPITTMYQNYELYREVSRLNPRWDAQANLGTRTHYVDDGTLRWFRARVLSTYVVDQGRLFALIESYTPQDPTIDNTRRFRFVVFNVCGQVIERAGLHDGWRTSDQARKAMWAYLDTVDAEAVTAQAIEWERKTVAEALDRLAQATEEATR